MIRIRLTRMGSKRQPVYRIVVSNQRNSRDGKFIEIIGHYNPRTRPATEVVNESRALYWLNVGAQPSEAVATILKHTGTLERLERLKKGEAIETLVAEAETNKPTLPSPKTNYPAPAAGQSWRKARESANRSES